MSAVLPSLPPVAEWHGVDARRFREEIVPRYEPAVLRGVVGNWRAVRESASPVALRDYLAAHDNGREVDALLLRPQERGRIFYGSGPNGFNYVRNQVSVSAVLEQLMRYAQFDAPPSVAIQSARICDCLPGFIDEHPMPLLDASVAPRLWLGNAIVTPAHFDESSNVACVAAGRRRFTLLPPEQLGNLYIGPLDHAPTGTPISLVSFREPDFVRFPRFRDALAAARVAELAPGDALYIPPLWWHHVESLDRLNLLVNYWWKDALPASGRDDSALDALLHGLLALRHLPAPQRAAWGAIFRHYLFDAADPVPYLSEDKRGVLGEISAERAAQVRAFLASHLKD